MEIKELYKRYIETGKVSTDTRQISSGSLFFALKGDRFNANEFADEALKKGAAYAIIDEAKYKSSERCIIVPNTLETLQQLAAHHRRQLSIPVIALTGSNGKTTSKELTNAVLSKKYHTYATKGNLNNHIGVPLTLLAIDSTVELAIIEMGANHVGEISLLCEIAHPTHGFITNIGKAHIGTFGGFENIVRGKTELYQHLIKNNGVVFVNSQNPILVDKAKEFKDPIFYPSVKDHYQCELVSADPFVKVKAENDHIIQTNLIGSYNFENIAAALCIGKYFAVDDDLANEAIADYNPSNMRSQIVQKGTNTIILDAYNANPSSMQAAIENLASIKAENKVVILGDMYELEDESEREHKQVGTLLKEKNLREIYLCGSLFKSALTEVPWAKHFGSKDDLLKALQVNPIIQSTILVKASRGIGLETILDSL